VVFSPPPPLLWLLFSGSVTRRGPGDFFSRVTPLILSWGSPLPPPGFSPPTLPPGANPLFCAAPLGAPKVGLGCPPRGLKFPIARTFRPLGTRSFLFLGPPSPGYPGHPGSETLQGAPFLGTHRAQTPRSPCCPKKNKGFPWAPWPGK